MEVSDLFSLMINR